MSMKKRRIITSGFLTAVIIGTLFLFMASSGCLTQAYEKSGSITSNPKYIPEEGGYPYKPNLVVGWQETIGALDFASIKNFLSANRIKFAAFEDEYGNIFFMQVKEAKGIEFPPCAKIDGTKIVSIKGKECISFQKGNAVKGFEHELTLYTEGSPYCVAKSTGGYVIEIDVRTGELCSN